MEGRWMTVQEVADYLHVSQDMIYRLAQKGKVPAAKIGGRWRFKPENIEQWMEKQSTGPRPETNELTILERSIK